MRIASTGPIKVHTKPGPFLGAEKRGRRTIVLADDLRRYLGSLPAVEPKA